MTILYWTLFSIIILLTAIIWLLLRVIDGAINAFWKGLGGG